MFGSTFSKGWSLRPVTTIELIQSYGDEFSNEFNQQGRAEQLFEHFEQATQLNITTHEIDPLGN